MNAIRTALIVALGFLASGCATTSYTQLRCISPAVGSPLKLTTIDTLQPTLMWASAGAGVTYDIRVWEVAPSATLGSGAPTDRVGTEVYARDGLTTTSHRLDTPLKSGAIYHWSVRTRTGSGVGPWSQYNYTSWDPVMSVNLRNALFVFVTPGDWDVESPQ